MFAKILIPSDGSVLGNLSALAGIEMAAKLGAEVVGVNARREYQKPGFGKLVSPSKEEFDVEANAASAEVLRVMKEAAAKAGVKFSGVTCIANHPAQAIVRSAAEQACDMIFIGSNGCAGWDHVIIGSVSNKVLATAHVPVLVYRLKEGDVPKGVSLSYESAFPM